MVALAALLFVCIETRGEFTKEFPKVDDTSYAETNGNRVLRISTEVPATTDEVWRLLSTAEGWKRFSVAFAVVDFQIGGMIETSYDAKAEAGNPANIKNEIVAYVPGKMLAIRCVQAPPKFENAKEFFSTATVMELERISDKRTKVTLTAVGFRPGAAYDDLYKKFRWGDSYTLERLRAVFEPKAGAAEEEK
jgi:uncharacterized protein YndB with AHSA1/START domain